jgi:hypothetical protein
MRLLFETGVPYHCISEGMGRLLRRLSLQDGRGAGDHEISTPRQDIDSFILHARGIRG